MRHWFVARPNSRSRIMVKAETEAGALNAYAKAEGFRDLADMAARRGVPLDILTVSIKVRPAF
jgi:hypothetical protein